MRKKSKYFPLRENVDSSSDDFALTLPVSSPCMPLSSRWYHVLVLPWQLLMWPWWRNTSFSNHFVVGWVFSEVCNYFADFAVPYCTLHPIISPPSFVTFSRALVLALVRFKWPLCMERLLLFDLLISRGASLLLKITRCTAQATQGKQWVGKKSKIQILIFSSLAKYLKVRKNLSSCFLQDGL